MLPTPQSPQRNLAQQNPTRSADLAEHVKVRLRARALERATSPLTVSTATAAVASTVTNHDSSVNQDRVNQDGVIQNNVAPSSADIMQQLLAEVRQLETAGRPTTHHAAISSGCAAIDNCLPDRGYVPGSVIEYLRAMPGCGASILAFSAAATAMRVTGGFLVVVDTQHNLYPPALASLGIDLEKVVLVRPQSDVDALWAVDQSLRTPAVAAVVADVERIDDRAARRMQLAAEQGGGLALLLRPASARRGPSWAEIQWLVRALPTPPPANPLREPLSNPLRKPLSNPLRKPLSNPLREDVESINTLLHRATPARAAYTAERRLQVQLMRVRGGKAGASVRLQVDAMDGTLREVERHEPTGAVHLASQLAGATSSSRRAAVG